MDLGDKGMKGWAGWLGLALLTIVAMAGCGSNNSTTVTLAVSPASATVLLNTSVQFTPTVTGSSNAVDWSVNGILNGNATVGTIASGLYTAPATLPNNTGAGVVAQVVSVVNNTAIPGSGVTGAVVQLQPGVGFTQFIAGNEITIAGNSVAAWDGTFPISAAAQLSNGNYGVQIPFQSGTPANGAGGTATVAVGITITAQVETTSAVATATVTLDSGIRVSIFPSVATIGTNEQFVFAHFVSGTPNTPAGQAVIWTVSGVGTIDPNSGLYVAPSTTGTATLTATSAVDTSQSASISVTVIAAVDPTVSSISPPTGALGATSQQVYLSGANFITTTSVLVNDAPLPSTSITSISSTTLLVALPDTILSTLPTAPATTVPLTFTAERQGGTEQGCSPLPCQVVLSPVRPAVVAATPDSIRPGGSGALTVNLDGGYFGATGGTSVVNVQFNGVAKNPQFNSDRQLGLNLTTSDVAAGAGLYPISVTNKVSGSLNGSMAVVNLAVQPSAFTIPTPTVVPVGAAPTSVAINTATGFAVVANRDSNDITIINLAVQPPTTTSLCTDGGVEPCTAIGGRVATAPVSVAVDNLRNLALVANSASGTLAVVDLSVPRVISLLTFPSASLAGSAFPLAPQAVGINPVSGRALVAFASTFNGSKGSNVGAILDMNQLKAPLGVVNLPAAVINVVNINNGPNPHIAVSSRLNWALATPGGLGSLSIVDLGRQNLNQITTIGRASGIVSVNTSATNSLRVGQPVLITGVADPSFDGIFSVSFASSTAFQYDQAGSAATSTGGLASYALPVATVATNFNVSGVGIDDETQKAILVDPSVPPTVPTFTFNMLDQTSTLVTGVGFGNVAAAMNPLTNIGVVVNQTNNQAFLIDPTTPTVLPGSTFSTGTSPIDVAIDPATNTAVIVNQRDNTVSLFSLGLLRSAPQIAQSSLTPVGSPQCPAQVIALAAATSSAPICSSLSSPAVAQNQTVELIGNFPTGSVPRLDGDPSLLTGVSISNGGRVLTATLSGATLVTNGPRQYTLDVLAGTPSNAARLQAIQAVSLITADCAAPAPQGVAIDAVRNVAVVTEPGCNDVSMVNVAYNDPTRPLGIGTGFGAQPEIALQQVNPQGIAVYPQAGLAVAANASNNSVSVIDIVNDDLAATFATDPIPTGVAINPATGQAVVTAAGASILDVFPVSTTVQTATPISVQQGPTGVAVDPVRNFAVVANSTSGTASLVALSQNAATNTTNAIVFPQGVALDPISEDFLITSSANNQVQILDPITGLMTAIRVGIDPSSIAYNFASSTLVTANNSSGTMTVVDFLDQTVRGVFSLPSSTQFAVAIHPYTNLAVVADSVHNQILLVPLPH
jgi:DNA-binding beta-propeller fold protein YncE